MCSTNGHVGVGNNSSHLIAVSHKPTKNVPVIMKSTMPPVKLTTFSADLSSVRSSSGSHWNEVMTSRNLPCLVRGEKWRCTSGAVGCCGVSDGSNTRDLCGFLAVPARQCPANLQQKVT